MEDGQIIERLVAIAHPTRLKAFRLLVKVGPAGLASGEIARRLAIPATTMSTHLAVLARSGLVAAQRDSRLINYAVQPEEVRAMFEALVSDCCDGRPELCAPLVSAPQKRRPGAAKPARRR